MMKSEDICREFRLAKDRKNQVKILSHENLVSPERILLILYENGEIQKWPEKYMLTKVLDILEERIRETEMKLDVLNSRYKSIADFAKGHNEYLGVEHKINAF